MPKRKVLQIIEGQWTEWNRNDRWLCCDCCLVHDVEFRIKGTHIEVRMFVNRRSTSAYRRGEGIKICAVKPNGHHRNTRSGKR